MPLYFTEHTGIYHIIYIIVCREMLMTLHCLWNSNEIEKSIQMKKYIHTV